MKCEQCGIEIGKFDESYQAIGHCPRCVISLEIKHGLNGIQGKTAFMQLFEKLGKGTIEYKND